MEWSLNSTTKYTFFDKKIFIDEKGLKVGVTGCSLTLKGHFLERNKTWRIILRVL